MMTINFTIRKKSKLCNDNWLYLINTRTQKTMNLKNIQTEVDASFLYGLLAEKEEDQNVKEVFLQM